jgi:hypothetical protein
MDKVNKLKENLLKNLDIIEKFDRVLEITIITLESLKKEEDCKNTFRQKLENQIKQLKNMDDAHSQSTVMPFIYQQEIVLLTSYIEAFLKDYFVIFCEIKFPEINHEKIKTNFQLNDFKIYDFDIKRIGELILQKENKYNFQNLNSIKITLGELFFIEITELLSENEIERFQCYLEVRHILVHNGGFINKKFCDVIGTGKIGNNISVSFEDVTEFKKIISKFGEKLIEKLTAPKVEL